MQNYHTVISLRNSKNYLKSHKNSNEVVPKKLYESRTILIIAAKVQYYTQIRTSWLIGGYKVPRVWIAILIIVCRDFLHLTLKLI